MRLGNHAAKRPRQILLHVGALLILDHELRLELQHDLIALAAALLTPQHAVLARQSLDSAL